MAKLPITNHLLVSRPGDPPGDDCFRWRVGLGGVEQRGVELTDTEAMGTGLRWEELDARLPEALDRWACAQLRNDLPVMEQVASWDAPFILKAHHFGASG